MTLLDGAEASRQAAGIDINVWTGLGMALTGVAFLGWMWRSPCRTGSRGSTTSTWNVREPVHKAWLA